MAKDNGQANQNMKGNRVFPVWNGTDPEESLRLIYEWAIARTEERILWYQEEKKPYKISSQWIRGFVVIFIAAGALCPLIDGTGVLGAGADGNKIILSPWGYIFLAVGAAIFAFDKFFGLSTGWMRFMVTGLSLERALIEFQYDWSQLKTWQKESAAPMTYLALLQRMKDFTLLVEDLVKQETDAWVLEFQSNITQLETLLKAEARKPGAKLPY